MRAGESALGSSSSAAGANAADAVSRQFKMTIDEACNIMNVQRSTVLGEEESLRELSINFERMMEANKGTSHYVQSKLVVAKRRIEAEM